MSQSVAELTWTMLSWLLVMAQKFFSCFTNKTTGWSRTGILKKKKNQHKKSTYFRYSKWTILPPPKVKNLNIWPNNVYNLAHPTNFFCRWHIRLFIQNVPARWMLMNTCKSSWLCTAGLLNIFFPFSSLHIVLSVFWPVT